MTTKWAARKRAQRAVPTLAGRACEDCGTTERLTRHHPDYSQPDLFRVLCRTCHAKADQQDGYRKIKGTKACKVCGKEFTPSHSKKHNTCSAECLSQLGRENAWKRWGRGTATGSKAPQE